jgi:hypothetical protein
MAGLNDFLTDTSLKTTTLPQWYDTAQQNLVSQAQTALGQTPQMQNTVANTAVQNLSGPQNPFLTAQSQLAQIGSGAANPWIVDQSTGQVRPNTDTALGGLFQAQNQQLQQTLPTLTAPAQAGAVGSGNFGSLRGQTAVNLAKGNALADLYSKQMQAALQAQQTGVQAGQALGNVGAQGTASMSDLGKYQQTAPLEAIGKYANILQSSKAPTSEASTTQLSPLAQYASAASLLSGGIGGLDSLIGKLSPGSSLGGLLSSAGSGLSNLFGSIFGGGGGGSFTLDPDFGGGTVDASSINSFLQQYPEYGSFFSDLAIGGTGYNPDVQD